MRREDRESLRTSLPAALPAWLLLATALACGNGTQSDSLHDGAGDARFVEAVPLSDRIATDPASAEGGALEAAGDPGPETSACTPGIEYTPHAILDLKLQSGEAANVADPCVLKLKDSWYLYATGTIPGVPLWVSQDLVDWEPKAPVWNPTSGTWNALGQMWAPHVQAAPDGYYLYYTANKQVGVAFAASPEGPFEEVYDHPLVGGGYGGIGNGVFEQRDKGFPALDFDEFSIDAFVLAASDGSLTLYATSYNPMSMIVAIPMSDYATVVPENARVVVEPAPSGWEFLVTEGPWVVEVADSIVLMYSGNSADSNDYALGIAVADNPLGPFEKAASNPFLKAVPDKGFFGPGHHSVAPGACNDRLMFYHTKVTQAQGWERRIRYTPIAFSGTEVVLPPLP